MNRHLSSTGAVIEALGGLQAVADLTGRGYSAAHNWKATGQFPANTYLLLRKALAAKGFDAPDTLWNMAESAERPVEAAE